MDFENRVLRHSNFVLIDGIHRLFEVDDRTLLNNIKSDLLRLISNKLGEQVVSLETLHTYIEMDSINPIRVDLFNTLNSGSYRWPEIIYSLCYDHICNVIGPDYLLQKKINLSIQMPGDYSSTLAMHSDCISGDSPWQLNLWIPLTKAHGTSSMYLVTMSESIRILEKLNNLKGLSRNALAGYREASELMNDCEKTFINADFGKILLFHPGVLHGNETNTTEVTRVSLNIRIKSIFSPDSCEKNPDRGVGSYYELANETAQFNFSQALTRFFR